MQPKVSVIVPVYNVECHVGACLESLRRQTFTDFEAIVVDDGSTDASLDAIRRCAVGDERFVVVHTDNQGVVRARETALARACGHYVCFLDGDDRWEPDMLERMVAAIEEDEDCDIVCCDFRRITARSEKTVCGPRPGMMTGREYLESLLCGETWGGLCAKCYDRRLFDDSLCHCPLPLWEDMLLNVQIACSSPRVRFVDYAGYLYYHRAGSASGVRFGFDYCRQFGEAMERELARRDVSLDGRSGFYATLNDLRVYLVYMARSDNRWNGDDPWVRDLAVRFDRHRRELKDFIPPLQRVMFGLNRCRAGRPFVLVLATFGRWKKSFERRRRARHSRS